MGALANPFTRRERHGNDDVLVRRRPRAPNGGLGRALCRGAQHRVLALAGLVLAGRLSARGGRRARPIRSRGHLRDDQRPDSALSALSSSLLHGVLREPGAPRRNKMTDARRNGGFSVSPRSVYLGIVIRVADRTPSPSARTASADSRRGSTRAARRTQSSAG